MQTKQIHKVTVALAFVSMIMIGCGGGGSGGDKTPPANNHQNGKDAGIGDGGSGAQYQNLVKHGKVLYSTSGSYDASVGGVSAMHSVSTGTKRYVFKDWGKTTLKEETEHTEITMNLGQGVQTSSEDTHEMSKTVGAVVYDVNFDQQSIRRTDYSALVDILTNPNAVKELNDKFKDSNLSYVDGEDTVLGYPCKVYKTPSLGTACYYKNIMLKMKTEITSTSGDGTTRIVVEEVATSIDFDSQPDESEFDLPNFPIESIN